MVKELLIMPCTAKTKKKEVQSPLMSIADGARYLKADVTLVRKAISCGELPVFDFGSCKLYKPTLDAFIIKWQNHGDENDLVRSQNSSKGTKYCGKN